MIYFPIYVQDYDGEYMIRYAAGENPALKPSEVKELISIFEEYIEDNTDEEIELWNADNKKRVYAELGVPTESKDSNYSSGYVYLFECGGKYKIGVSSNVNRRLKELDNRPFKVNIVTKVYSNMAYKVEQTIHACLKKHNLKGEWYDFPTPPTAEWFESLVKRVEDDKRRTNEW